MFPKIDMRNTANFHQSTWKSPNWDLDDILLSKVENVYMNLSLTGELCVMTMKKDVKIEEELTMSVQNWHEEFDEFWHKHSKTSKICTLTLFRMGGERPPLPDFPL